MDVVLAVSKQICSQQLLFTSVGVKNSAQWERGELAVQCVGAAQAELLIRRCVKLRVRSDQQATAFHLLSCFPCLDVILAKSLSYSGCSNMNPFDRSILKTDVVCMLLVANKAELTFHKSNLHCRLADNDTTTSGAIHAVHKQLHGVSCGGASLGFSGCVAVTSCGWSDSGLLRVHHCLG